MQGEELKPRVDTEWAAYLEANPDAGHSTHDRFNFHNKKMQEWYEETDAEVKKQVEAFRQQRKDELVDEGDESDNTNRLLQK